jgi:hypothetical protein
MSTSRSGREGDAGTALTPLLWGPSGSEPQPEVAALVEVLLRPRSWSTQGELGSLLTALRVAVESGAVSLKAPRTQMVS